MLRERLTTRALLAAALVAGLALTGCDDTQKADAAKAQGQKQADVDKPTVTLLYNTDENHKLVAEAVQDMWKRNLGLDVKLENKEWKTYLQDVDTLNYQVARAGWIGDYNDPMTFLDMFQTGNGNNDTGWSDPEYDKLLEQARAETDNAKRTELLQQAEAILLERGPVIPVYFYTNNTLVARRLNGFEPHNRDIHLLKYMSLGEPEEGQEFVAGDKADQLTFAVAADPETFDTAQMSGAPEGRIAFQIFEGLLVPGPTTEGLEDPSELVRPGVAESFDISEDGKTYTFHLRDDAKWSDGNPVTAEDFVYSWKRVLEPGFPADYASMLHIIEGAKAYNTQDPDKRTIEFDTVGIKAKDAQTLEVTLNNPTPYFPELVAFYTFFPVPKQAVEEHGEEWTKPENIVTNGAYTLAAYEPQQELLLTKNANYWDADNVKVDRARARIIDDREAVVKAYKAGELHWTGAGLPLAQITGLLTHPDYQRSPLLGTYYYRVNVSDKDSIFAKPEFRRALSLAIDRESLTDNVLNGLYEPAGSYVPTSMPGYSAPEAVEATYQIKKAKDLLQAAMAGDTAEATGGAAKPAAGSEKAPAGDEPAAEAAVKDEAAAAEGEAADKAEEAPATK